jgi:hypothetical protein
MKKLVLFFSFFFVATVTAIAQDFGLNIQTGIRSQYVGPDGLMFYRNPVLQGSFALEHKITGLYFDLWYSAGLDFYGPRDWGDEIDYTIGWVNNKKSPLRINVSLSYFDNFKIFHGPNNDVIKGNLRFELPTKVNDWLVLSPYVNYITFRIPGKNNPLIGGNLFSLGLSDEIGFTPVTKTLSLFQITRDDGAFGVEPGYMFKTSLSFALKLTDHLDWCIVEATLYSPLGQRKITNEELKYMPREWIISTCLSWNM